MQPNEALLHNWFYGNYFVRVFGIVAFSYLMGSMPFRNLAAWFFTGLDERFMRTARGFVPVMNLLKTFVPVVIATHGGGHAVGALAAVAAVLGDCFCPWLRFRDGGRGAAAQLGALCGFCWPAALAFALVWLTVALSSNYTAVATVFATVAGIAPLWFYAGSPGAACALALIVIVLGAHRANGIRLLEGREPAMRPERIGRGVRSATSVVRLSGQPVQSF